MGCVYNYQGKDSLGLDALVEAYYKSNALLTNKNIYSSEEIIQSVREKILRQVNRKDEIISMGTDYTDADGKLVKGKKALTSLVSDENEELMKSVRRTNLRFSPQYKENERILKFIKDSLIDAKTLPNDEVSLGKSIKELEGLDNFAKFKSDILGTIEAEKKSIVLMAGLKAAIFKALKDPNGYTNLESFIRPILETAVDNAIKNELLVDGDKEAMMDKLVIQAIKTIGIISNHGEPIVDILLTTEPENVQQINGHIDIVTIDTSGNVNIFSIRSSKKEYSQWDSAKKLDTDYRLAFQRALLGQYVNIRNTNLIVIPITTGELVDGKIKPSSFSIGDHENRTADTRAGLGYGIGELFQIANTIIPNRIQVSNDSQRLEKIYHDLNIMLPDYKIKISSRVYNKELGVKNIMRSTSFAADYGKEFMSHVEKDTIDKYGLRESAGRLFTRVVNTEEANKIMDMYLSFVTSQTNHNVVKLKNAIISAVVDPTKNSLELSNIEQSKYINTVLRPFLNGHYRVLNSVQELDELGVILLQNVDTGKITPISISANNFRAKNTDGQSYGLLEHFKVFTLLNNLYDELNLDVNRIQAVIVVDLDNKATPSENVNNAFEEYKKVAIKKSYDLKFNEKLLPTLEETIQQNLYGLAQTYNLPDKEKVLQIFEGLTSNAWETDIDTLIKIANDLKKLYPELEERTIRPDLNFTDPKEYLYTLVNVLLLAKRGIIPKGDVTGLRDFALGFEDWFGVIQAFYAKDLWTYNKREDKVVGFLAGLKMITPDKVPSEDLRAITGIISGSIDMLSHEVLRRATEVQKHTMDYYEAISYGGIWDNILGNHRKVFTNLWLKDGDKVSNKWSTKNPYDTSRDNAMEPAERTYLKKVLFDIQRQLMEIPIDISKNVNVESLETIKKTAPAEWVTKILEAIQTGDYFRMPLIRSQYLSRNKKMFTTDPEAIKRGLASMWSETRDFINPGELSPEDLVKIKQTVKGYYEMFDVYGRQTTEFVSNAVDNDTPDQYEIDLDTIAHRVIQAKVRKKYINKVLPIINSYMWWIKLAGGVQNKDISKALKYVQDRVDISFYDKSIIDSEVEDIITAASVAKTITTAGMLAFRPVFLFKEGIIGLYKGVSIAATKYFGKDQFTLAEYMRAMKELTMVDNKFSTKFNLLDRINHFYRFANLDINSYSKKIQTNRRGLLMGLSKYMYSCNTLPDYYNRLSLFIAKMIHDGSYDAHSLDSEGQLIYNPKADKRFEHYFLNRDKHLNSIKGAKEKYVSATNDEKYNFQRNHYLLVMNEINDSKRQNGEEEFVEDDLIDQAYSEKERQSYKSFTDTVYGYYDKEAAPTWHYAWYGIVFLQFMQFWPGKMSVWFSNPTENVGGKHRQKTMIGKDGKKVPVWRDISYDEDGNVVDNGETEKNTGNPALEWTGNVHEGVIYSFAKTIQDTVRGMGVDGKSWGEVKEGMLDKDENRLARVKYGLADGLFMYMIFMFLKMMFDMAFEDQKEGIGNETRKFGNSLSKKILSEANVPNNTIFAIKGQFLPWTYGTKVLKDTDSVINGNKTMTQLFSNFRAFEFLDDPSQRGQ